MPSAQPPIDGTAASLPVLWIACGAFTVIVIALVAAWLIHSIARDALAKAEPEDVPEVLTALSGMLEGFHGLAHRRINYVPRQGKLTDDVFTKDSVSSGGGK